MESSQEVALSKLLDAVCPDVSADSDGCVVDALPDFELRLACHRKDDDAAYARLDDLTRDFEGMRDKHTRFMGGARRTPAGPRCAPAPFPTATGTAPATAVRSKANEEKEEEKEEEAPPSTVVGKTFMYAMLTVVDPMATMLRPEEASRCVDAFVDKAARNIARDVVGVASAYRAAFKSRAPLDDVMASLQNPEHALSDQGLNDAVLLRMCTLVGITVVLRKDGPGSPCAVYPPIQCVPLHDVVPLRRGVLITWRDGAGFELQGKVGPLRDVQRFLGRELTELRPELRGAVERDAMKRDELRDVAALLAAPLPAKATKGQIRETVLGILSLPA
jgi:hypothetical protein